MANLRPIRTTPDTWFNRGTPAPFETNRRMSIRYVRNDIGVMVRKIDLFNFSFLANRNKPVKLVDISSRGVMIATTMRLATGKKIVLTIRFPDFREFEISGKVVRKAVAEMQIYGIKFDHTNDVLADHLIATQRKLAFK